MARNHARQRRNLEVRKDVLIIIVVVVVIDIDIMKNWEGVDEGLVLAQVVEVEELLELPLEHLRGRKIGVTSGLWKRGRGRQLGVFDLESHEEVKETGDEEEIGKEDYECIKVREIFEFR